MAVKGYDWLRKKKLEQDKWQVRHRSCGVECRRWRGEYCLVSAQERLVKVAYKRRKDRSHRKECEINEKPNNVQLYTKRHMCSSQHAYTALNSHRSTALKIEAADKLKPIADEIGCSQAQLAVAWCVMCDEWWTDGVNAIPASSVAG